MTPLEHASKVVFNQHKRIQSLEQVLKQAAELSSAYKRCIDEFDDYERRKTDEIADLESQLEIAQKPNAELLKMKDHALMLLDQYEEQRDTAEQKLKTAEDALAAVRIYAKHSSHCALNDNDFPCTCGLDDLKERP